jgi:hypothetical protein
MGKLVLRATYRNARRYGGYLLAATIAVATFCSFGFLAFHPDLNREELPDVVAQVLVLGQVGVALFAAFFVTFFHRFLLRARGAELGLLLTLGMSPRQLGRMLWLESLLLAGVAGLLGLLVSVAITYGLVRGLGSLLGISAIGVTFAPPALVSTTLFFGLLFGVDAVLSARLAHRLTPKQLLLAPRLHQPSTGVSPARVVAGLGCLLVAYLLALVVSANDVAGVASMLPILVLCAVGTYLLFDQILVGALGALRRRTRSGMLLLLASRLSHRVRDYARLLTVVTLLSAGVLTLMSVVTGALAYIRQTATSAAEYRAMVQIVAVTLFVCGFLSCLCLIAAASTLQVKLFTQLDDDRRQFAQLRRVGVSRRGLAWLLLGEWVVLFLAPVVVAALHSAVAIGEVTLHLIPDSATEAISGTWFAYAVVVAGYLLIFTCYGAVTWQHYWRRALQA